MSHPLYWHVEPLETFPIVTSTYWKRRPCCLDKLRIQPESRSIMEMGAGNRYKLINAKARRSLTLRRDCGGNLVPCIDARRFHESKGNSVEAAQPASKRD